MNYKKDYKIKINEFLTVDFTFNNLKPMDL